MRTINKLAVIALAGSLAGYGLYRANAAVISYRGEQTISHTGQGTAYDPCGSGTTLDCAIKRANADALEQLKDYCDYVKSVSDDCDADCYPNLYTYADLDESSVTYEVLKTKALSGGVKVTVKATGVCRCRCESH